MRKGAQLRKCYYCGKRLFWIIPDKCEFGLFYTATIEQIEPSTVVKGRYCCIECAEKIKESEEHK